MKNGSIFDAYDIDKFEQWKHDRYYKLGNTVITAYFATANDPDPAVEFVHGFLREILLASGYTEEGLEVWEMLSKRGSDHAS